MTHASTGPRWGAAEAVAVLVLLVLVEIGVIRQNGRSAVLPDSDRIEEVPHRAVAIPDGGGDLVLPVLVEIGTLVRNGRFAVCDETAPHRKYFTHGSLGSGRGVVAARRALDPGSKPNSLPRHRNCASFAATIPCGLRSNAACSATHMCARGASIGANHGQRRTYASHSSRCRFGSFTGGSSWLSDARSRGMSRGIGRCSRLPSMTRKAAGLGFRPAIAKAVSPDWFQPLLSKPEILKSDNAYGRLHRSAAPKARRNLHPPWGPRPASARAAGARCARALLGARRRCVHGVRPSLGRQCRTPIRRSIPMFNRWR